MAILVRGYTKVTAIETAASISLGRQSPSPFADRVNLIGVTHLVLE